MTTPYDLLKLGFYIFPCVKGGKAPLTKNGLYAATNDFNQVTEWLEQYPGCNWGIACGAKSNLLVIDVDPRNGGFESFDRLLEDASVFSIDAAVKTGGGGFHYYFYYDENIPSQKLAKYPGIDIQSEGKYVIVLGSTTGPYQVQNLGRLILSPSLKDLLTPKPARTVTSSLSGTSGVTGSSSAVKGKLAAKTWEFIANGVAPGFWNDRLHRAAKDLQENNYSFDEAIELLTRPTELPGNEGLLTKSDLRTIESAYSKPPKYEPRLPTYEAEGPGAETETLPDDRTLVVNSTELASGLILRPSDFVNESLSYLDDKDLVRGLPTEIAGLDDLLGGGKRLGEITGLTAVAKAGKNAFLHYTIHKWLKKGIKVGYASRELSPQTEVTPNLLALTFAENAWTADMTEERKAKYREEILSWPIYYLAGYGYTSFDDFKAWVIALKAEGVEYFILDHLLYSMQDPENFKEVSLFMRNLKTLVNEQQIHLDLVIQPGKIQFGEKISMNHLRGGANIAQAINTLLTLERVPNERNISKVTLEIGRSRLCKQGSIYLKYNPIDTSFEEVVEEDVIPPVNDSPPTFNGPTLVKY